jgi:hypothetical protein
MGSMISNKKFKNITCKGAKINIFLSWKIIPNNNKGKEHYTICGKHRSLVVRYTHLVSYKTAAC